MMRMSRTLFSVFAFVMLGWIVAIETNGHADLPEPKESIKWEYHVSADIAVGALNRLGGDGWELVAVYEQVPGSHYAILKRLKGFPAAPPTADQ